jgi:hypothetical protein
MTKHPSSHADEIGVEITPTLQKTLLEQSFSSLTRYGDGHNKWVEEMH